MVIFLLMMATHFSGMCYLEVKEFLGIYGYNSIIFYIPFLGSDIGQYYEEIFPLINEH